MRPLIFRMGLVLLGLLWSLQGSNGWAQVSMAPKQLLVVKPGTDRILITWVAAVINKGDGPVAFSVPVLLPQEAKDFQPIEGINPDDLKLGETGLTVEKEFPPGVNVISLGFTIPATFGNVDLHVKSRSDLGELTVMTPKGLLEIKGRDLVESGTDVQDMQRYNVLSSNRMILTGDELQISVGGVPEGRGRLWILGLVFAGMMVVAVVFLVKKSMPVAAIGEV